MQSVKPINYDLFLYNLEFLGKWSYQGTVKIDLEVKFPAKKIVLNAHQLIIHGARLFTQETSEQAANASNITYDQNAQRVTLHFDQDFAIASKAFLEIKFQGTANNVSKKLSNSLYKTNSQCGAHGWLLSLPLQACC
jgi:aminopeptidase N